MDASVSARSKSNRLPARTAQGIQVRMLWSSAVVDEIDQWAAAQPDKPNRSEAILRLVQQALAGATCKEPENPRSSLTDVLKAASASPTPASPLAALPPPKRGTERIGFEVGRSTREVTWKPRLVKAGGIPEVAKAKSLTKPVEEAKLYEMPEDIRAFNEYWKLAELILRRQLQYEEVLLAYNRYRQGEQRRPVLPLTDRDIE
jgi:hypothetical protein